MRRKPPTATIGPREVPRTCEHSPEECEIAAYKHHGEDLVCAAMAVAEGHGGPFGCRVPLDCRVLDIDGHRPPEYISNEALAKWIRQRLQQCTELHPLCLCQLADTAYADSVESLVRLPCPSRRCITDSTSMTTFNVVISLLSMFILLVKASMYVLHCFIPALSVFVHALLVALYCVSIYNQSRPDMTDLEKPSPGLPWYISKGCSYATPGNHGYCMQARATFAVVIVMM